MKKLIVPAVCIGLAACGGGGGGDGGAPGAGLPIVGTLVVPETGSEAVARFLVPTNLAKAAAGDCATVPAGYAPLAGASVLFVDDQGAELGTSVTTDACGVFSAIPPGGATAIRAIANDYRPINAQISVFANASAEAPAVVSTISAQATYEIGTLQRTEDGNLVFTVTDSESKKAVLGISASAVSALVGEQSRGLTKLDTAAAVQDASIVLVLDASGSMYEPVYFDEAAQKQYTRFQLAAVASHLFLDQKSPSDEIGISIFSDQVDFMTPESLNRQFPAFDASFQPVVLPYPLDGFATDAAQQRFVIDAYNHFSKLYDPAAEDDVHPQTPAVRVIASYPYGGSTALYDAMVQAVETVGQRTNGRPAVVVMTDGEDTSSIAVAEDVINAATVFGVPIHTVRFGADANGDVLSAISAQTGGNYLEANSIDLADAFTTIQTGIRFQYIATLAEALDATSPVTLTLILDGLTVSRTLEGQQSN